MSTISGNEKRAYWTNRKSQAILLGTLLAIFDQLFVASPSKNFVLTRAVGSSNHHIGAARQHYLSIISIVVVYVVWFKTHCFEWVKQNRLQNNPYFYIVNYARTVKRKVWRKAENGDWDWRETLEARMWASVAAPALFAWKSAEFYRKKKTTVLKSKIKTKGKI